MAGRDPEQLDSARRGHADELLELTIENSNLTVERADAMGDRAQRKLRGVGRSGKLVGRGSEPATQRGLAADRLGGGKLVAELLRGSDDQPAELNDRGAAGLHGAVASCAQQPDRLDNPIGLLRDRSGRAPTGS